jgi:hypothetical protein
MPCGLVAGGLVYQILSLLCCCWLASLPKMLLLVLEELWLKEVGEYV